MSNDDVDLGQPVTAELSKLVDEPTRGFLARVRRRIERRALTSQLVSISWHAPKIFVLEMLALIFHLFSPRGGDGGGSS